MRAIRWLFIITFLALPGISGCAGAGGQPQTPRETLVTLEYSYQAALLTVENLVDTGRIKGDDAQKAATLVTNAKQAMGSARVAVLSGQPNSLALVTAANSIVTQLVLFLESKKGGG